MYTYRNIVRGVAGLKGGALCVLEDADGDLLNRTVTAGTLAANAADVAALTTIEARQADLAVAQAAQTTAGNALHVASAARQAKIDAAPEDTDPDTTAEDAAIATAQANVTTADTAAQAIVDDIAAKQTAADAALGATVVAAVNEMLAATGNV